MIIGVDEVNFSPSIAGDCVVCALLPTSKVTGVRDSKLLTHEQRLAIWPELAKHSAYTIALATVHDINQIGIHLARNNAIISAARQLLDKLYAMQISTTEASILVDGYFSAAALNLMRRKIGIPVTSLIKADKGVYEVAAASIAAKVYVDALFAGFGAFYPGYNLETNHGSPDPIMYHRLRERGPTPYHRTNYGKSWWGKIMAGEDDGIKD